MDFFPANYKFLSSVLPILPYISFINVHIFLMYFSAKLKIIMLAIMALTRLILAHSTLFLGQNNVTYISRIFLTAIRFLYISQKNAGIIYLYA